MNIKSISANIGKALLINALFMFISAGVSALYGLDSGFTPLLISGIVTLIAGAFPFIFVRETPRSSLQDGFLTIVMSWLLSFIFGMLPYILWGGEFTIVNAKRVRIHYDRLHNTYRHRVPSQGASFLEVIHAFHRRSRSNCIPASDHARFQPVQAQAVQP